MATPIRIKRSSVPGKVPSPGSLQYGELALNINDAELYAVRNRVGIGSEVVKIGAGATVTDVIYVTQDGKDTNTGERLGEAKRTIGAAVTTAREGTIISVSAGSYLEDNPIVLPKQVSVVGSSLREVSIIPQNIGEDLFHVTNGNYITECSFTGTASTGAIFAFNPNKPAYINQSPYIRNCSNFIPDSIGMKVDGSDAIGPTKSMVTDSFTQYNANGIGVSITNGGYAQIVSMFTICNNISVYAGTGGQCDLSASNTSFGNYGLVSSGVSTVRYVGALIEESVAGQSVFTVDIDEPFYDVTNIEYDNNTGLTTVTLLNDHNFNVGCAFTIGNALLSVNEVDGYVELPNLYKDNVFDVKEVLSSNKFTAHIGISTLTGYTYNTDSNPVVQKYNTRPFNGQIVYFDIPYFFVSSVNIIQPGSGYVTPPTITIDPPPTDFGRPPVLGAILGDSGEIVTVDIIDPGSGYVPGFTPTITIESSPTLDDPLLEVVLTPTYYTISESTPVVSGITTITLSESVPYAMSLGQNVDFHTQSKILGIAHGFEYVGTGTSIATAVPGRRNGTPIEQNQVVKENGGIVVYTSTDQLGKFKIGDGIVIDQTTGTISGIDYKKSLFSTMTPLILALGD